MQAVSAALLAAAVILSAGPIAARHDDTDRIDCAVDYENVYDKDHCEARGCIWSPSDIPGIPYCYFDRKTVGYKVVNSKFASESGLEVELKVKSGTKKVVPRFEPIPSLKLTATYLTDHILRIKIYDPNNERYEVPIQKDFQLLKDFEDGKLLKSEAKYRLDVSRDDFSFAVSRAENNETLLDTSVNGLIFSDQFIQLSTYLASKNVYGLGENSHESLKHDLQYKSWAAFNRGAAPGKHQMNLYGHHPFFECLESDGKAHGVLVLNSNALEYTLMPAPALNLKLAGGILDIFVFVGDNPEHVVQLYTSLVGRPAMPPFYGMGFQLSRYGYKNTSHLRDVVERNLKARIPTDVHYADIDYMEGWKDFTIDPKNFAELPEFFDEMRTNHSIRWAIILDPIIQGNEKNYEPFTDGYNQDVFVRWPKDFPVEKRHNPPDTPNDKDVMYGDMWPKGPAAYPDYFRNATHSWWQKWIGDFHKKLRFDALWIDMNEVSDFAKVLRCPDNKYDIIDAKFKNLANAPKISQGTLCMMAVQGENDEYRHYDVHSLYGLSEMIATQKALHAVTAKRGFVVSRATFAGAGRYGTHWLGDNYSRWHQMKQSIIQTLEFSMFGMPYVGPDICGHMENATPELCYRWSQLGAYYPFSRNHKTKGAQSQDPAWWSQNGHPEVTDAARVSLHTRYALISHLYTLFFRARVDGSTIYRPLFHNYPTDSETFAIDEQFMWGRDVLFSPLIYQNQSNVKAYLPPASVWYHLVREEGKRINQMKFERVKQTGWVTLPDEKDVPIHVRGGSIIPFQEPAMNTARLEKEPFWLYIFPDANDTAYGELFLDDGESIDSIEKGKYNLYAFKSFQQSVVIATLHWGLEGHSLDLAGFVFESSKPRNVDDLRVQINGEEFDIDRGMRAQVKKSLKEGSGLVLPINVRLGKEDSVTVTWTD